MKPGQFYTQVTKKTTKILAGVNIPVYTEGFAPRVEYDPKTKKPKAVFLPDIPDGATMELVNAINGYIDHEVGHILNSSNEDICDPTKSQLWHYIHNCIEDPRVNAEMANRFIGSEHNIKAGYEFIFKRVDPALGISPYDPSTVDAIDFHDEEAVKDAQVRYSSVWFAAKAHCRFHGPKYADMGLERLYGPLEAKMDADQLAALGELETTQDVKEATDYFVSFFHKEFSESKGKGEGDPSDADGPPTEGRLEEAKKLEDELGEAIKNEVEHLAKRAKSNPYFSNRWDKNHSREDIIKGAKAKLKEFDVAGFEDEVKRVSNYLIKDLRRYLEARNRRYWTGGFRSGKLNQSALHSVRAGNDRIFMHKSEIRSIRASVSLLIDLSGSMSGSPVKIAAQSAYAFALVLEQLKVPYEIWGFSSSFGTHPAKQAAWEEFRKTIDPKLAAKFIAPMSNEEMFAFKRFDEHFDLHSKAALYAAAQSAVGMRNNEDSWHVKSALERLGARPEERKTLFVFSDGEPAYAGDGKVSQEMLKYLDANSMNEYDVSIFGIGIESHAVKHYYKNSKVVNKLEDLPAALFETLRTRV